MLKLFGRNFARMVYLYKFLMSGTLFASEYGRWWRGEERNVKYRKHEKYSCQNDWLNGSLKRRPRNDTALVTLKRVVWNIFFFQEKDIGKLKKIEGIE